MGYNEKYRGGVSVKKNKDKKVKVTWKVRKVKDSARVNMMYCFKSCEVNQN